MSIQDYLGRETVQMTLIIIVTMFFHYYFIRQRLYPDFPTNPRPEDNAESFGPIRGVEQNAMHMG